MWLLRMLLNTNQIMLVFSDGGNVVFHVAVTVVTIVTVNVISLLMMMRL